MSAPLLVTADERLLDDVLRLAAAAGVVLDVAHDAGSSLVSWSAAALVLVGDDVVGDLALLRPPRRDGVHVVARGEVRDAVFREALEVGAEDVASLPASEGWLVEVVSDAGDGVGPPGVAVGVIGGSGGVGATVFAAALAATCGPTWRTLVIDADPTGAGVDRVLGMERLEAIGWEAIGSTTGRLSARALRESLPSRRGVAVLGWGASVRTALQPFAAREALAAGQRGHDVVVLDLPRHRDPVGEELLTRCDHVVLLAGRSLSAVTAASRVANRLAVTSAVPHLVVRGRTGVEPEEVARALAIPLAAVMSDQRGLDEAIDLGAGPLRSRRGTLARAARQVAGVVTRSAALVA